MTPMQAPPAQFHADAARAAAKAPDRPRYRGTLADTGSAGSHTQAPPLPSRASAGLYGPRDARRRQDALGHDPTTPCAYPADCARQNHPAPPMTTTAWSP